MYNGSLSSFTTRMLKTKRESCKGQFNRKPGRVLEIKKKNFCGHILSWPVPERAILEALLAEGAVLDSEFNSTNIYQIPAV